MNMEDRQKQEDPQIYLEENMSKMSISDEDDSSPRGVLEIPISGGESDSSTNCGSSSSSGEKSIFLLAQQALLRDSVGSHWRTMVDAMMKKSIKKFTHIPLLGNNDHKKKRIRRKLPRIRSAEEALECGPIPKPSWRNFDYAELSAATENFGPERLIGKGGHAEVYKGRLSDGQVVAVKKIIKYYEKEEEEKVADFLTELGIIAHINHPNAAHLLGFSIEKGLYLVLQLLPLGSLADVLHGSAECLEWKTRFKVAVGVAEGLKYLHHDCPRRIIHRDIKASNILLTEDYEAQISDFGLAKWLPEKWAHHVVFPIEGTFGYLAPEYFMHGIVDENTDIFAFGVLLLEIITGRHAIDSSRQSLVMWAKPLLDSDNIDELVDPRIGYIYDPNEMQRALTTASMCIEHLPEMRPSMKRVVQMLKGVDNPMEMKQKSKNAKTDLLNGCDWEDYTSSSYINALNRHRQLALG